MKLEEIDVRSRLRKGHRELQVTELMVEAAFAIDILLVQLSNEKIRNIELQKSLEHAENLLKTYQKE